MARQLQQYKYPSEDIADALRQANGKAKIAAKIVGCSIGTIMQRIYREPDLAELCSSVITGYFFKYSIDEMTDGLRQANGNVSDAASIVGCSRTTVVSYINRIPEIKIVYLEETDRLKDLAVSRLYEAVDRGEPWAIALAIRYHESVFRLYGASGDGTQIIGDGNGDVDLTELSDEQLDQLYEISQRLEGSKAGVVEAEVD